MEEKIVKVIVELFVVEKVVSNVVKIDVSC